MRYILVYICLFALAFPALWVLLQILSTVSFFWLVSGGSMRLHQVGYYLFTSIIVVVWISGVIIAESSFRASIDAVRIRRARTTPDSTQTEAASNRVIGLLRRLGLDIFAPRLAKTVTILVGLIVLNYLIEQTIFYLLSG